MYAVIIPTHTLLSCIQLKFNYKFNYSSLYNTQRLTRTILHNPSSAPPCPVPHPLSLVTSPLHPASN